MGYSTPQQEYTLHRDYYLDENNKAPDLYKEEQSKKQTGHIERKSVLHPFTYSDTGLLQTRIHYWQWSRITCNISHSAKK